MKQASGLASECPGRIKDYLKRSVQAYLSACFPLCSTRMAWSKDCAFEALGESDETSISAVQGKPLTHVLHSPSAMKIRYQAHILSFRYIAIDLLDQYVLQIAPNRSLFTWLALVPTKILSKNLALERITYRPHPLAQDYENPTSLNLRRNFNVSHDITAHSRQVKAPDILSTPHHIAWFLRSTTWDHLSQISNAVPKAVHPILRPR